MTPRNAACWLLWCLLPAVWAQPPLSETRMRSDLVRLTSKELRGRLSLDVGADRAARFIAAEFEKAGLKPANQGSFFQEFRVAAFWPGSRDHLYVYQNGSRQEIGFSIDFAVSFPRWITVRAPLVSVGYGITAPEFAHDDYAGKDVRGKIVLVRDGEPAGWNPGAQTLHAGRWMKAWNAQQHGAAGLLAVPISNPAPGGGAGPVKGFSMRMQALEDAGVRIPVFVIGEALAAKLAGADVTLEMRAGGRQAHGRSMNVLGVLEGSDPALRNETVLIGAHYDHLGTHHGKLYAGANDNASGVAGVLELARAFAGQPRPRRTILFAAFGSEEEGMLGSQFYVTHPARPLSGTVAINLDMIGRNDFINVGGAFYTPEMHRYFERQAGAAGLSIRDDDSAQNLLFRSDHFPFLLRQVPAVWIYGGSHPEVHQPSDTVDRLDFSELLKITSMVRLAAGALADAPALPRFRLRPPSKN